MDTDSAPNERLTRAGFFVGTLMYVAPEALSGEVVTAAADQYSLGTIAYLLLTGVLPYTAKTPRDMFTQLLTQPPIALNKAVHGIAYPSSVETAVMKALAKAPADRFPDVLAFAKALEVALQDVGKPGSDDGGLFSKMKGFFGLKS